jgi:putative cell wall-binding protein/plastocyanin
MPIKTIPRGPITDLIDFSNFSVTVPAGSPATPDPMPPDAFNRRVFYGNKQVLMPDGQLVTFWGFFNPETQVVQFPSEPIRVRRGQLVHDELNAGKNTHTIHHHGIEPTPMNDGVGHHSFEVNGLYTYQWRAAQDGTFFYHCHKNTVLHFEMGMYGALIVDPPEGPGFVSKGTGVVPYDREAIWVADDVDPMWHGMSHSAGIGFPFGADVGLNHFDPKYFMISGVPHPNTRTDGRVVLNANVGETLLLRIINGAYSLVRVTIQGLDAEVVEHDGKPLGQPPHGTYNQPYTIAAGAPFELSTAQRRAMLVKPTQPGTYKVTFEFEHTWVRRGQIDIAETYINVAGPAAVTYASISGPDRYATAASASAAAFVGGAPGAVVANGTGFADALAGAALAGATGGPLLLTRAASLPPATAEELRRLGATRATLLGGPAAVSAAARSQVAGALAGDQVVDRVSGVDRYATAAAVAAAVKARRLAAGKTWDGVVFIANGTGFADALSASPIAAAKGWPILLTGGATLHPATEAALASLGVTRAIVLGGTGAVGSAVESRLKALLGAIHVERVFGLDRYATSVEIARFAVLDAGLAWRSPALATGADFPDALAGGVHQGAAGSVLLLTPGTALHPDVDSLLAAHATEIKHFTFIGGPNALSTAVRNRVHAILGV